MPRSFVLVFLPAMNPQNSSAEALWKFYKHKKLSSKSSEKLERKIKNQILQERYKLVREIAHRMSRVCSIPYEDLEQIAAIGMLSAIEKFDPTKGIAFSSFAVSCMKGEILHFLRDHGSIGKVPRRWRELNSKINKAEQLWASQKGRLPSESELAIALHLSPEQIRQVRSTVSQCEASLSDPKYCQAAEELHFEEAIVSPSRQVLESAWSKLRKDLSELPTPERQVVEQVYFDRLSRNLLSREAKEMLARSLSKLA